MKCEKCGGELPFKIYGEVRCEYCNTANLVPIPEQIKESFKIQPELIAKGTFHAFIPGTKCRLNVGNNEVTISSGWVSPLMVKVDGKKLRGSFLLSGKKEWVFEIGENLVKLVVEARKLFGPYRAAKYEVYVTKINASYEETKTSVSEDDSISKLERLGKLKEQGLLTEEEFLDQKEKIL